MYGLCIINEFVASAGSRNLNFQKNLKKAPLGPKILILKNLKKSQKMLKNGKKNGKKMKKTYFSYLKCSF